MSDIVDPFDADDELIVIEQERTRAAMRLMLAQWVEWQERSAYDVSVELVGDDEDERQRVVARWWVDLDVVLSGLAGEVSAKAAMVAAQHGVR